MRTAPVHRLILGTALGLAVLATAAACDSSRHPGRTAPTPALSTVPSATDAPTVTPTTAPAVGSPAPTVPPTDNGPPVTPAVRPAPAPPPCLGAVLHVIRSDPARPTPARLCMAVGGVLRIERAGPGDVTITPSDKVDCFYAAGVHVCRLVATGTVRITVRGLPVEHLTLTIRTSGSPPVPPTACVASGTYVLDGSEGEMGWPAICVRRDVRLQIRNVGPAAVRVSSEASVSCRYEAGVWNCRFLRTGTVEFTVTRPDGVRPLVVVVVP